MMSRTNLRGLLVRSAGRPRANYRQFSASGCKLQAETGSGSRSANGSISSEAWSKRPKTWSGSGVVAVAAAVAVASWGTAWAVQKKGTEASASDLSDFGVDVEPRFATMDEMKEVGAEAAPLL